MERKNGVGGIMKTVGEASMMIVSSCTRCLSSESVHPPRTFQPSSSNRSAQVAIAFLRICLFRQYYGTQFSINTSSMRRDKTSIRWITSASPMSCA